MKLRFLAFSTVLLFALPFQSQASAQAGGLRGAVVDPSGAGVLQASVSLIRAGSVLQTTSSAPDGIYVFHSVAPGRYEVSVAAKGFAPLSIPDVEIAPGATKELKL